MWCQEWKLQLNLNKCVCVRLGLTHTTALCYQINSTPIPSKENHRDLGVIVSDNLSFSAQYKSMCNAAYRSLNFIKQTLHGSTYSLLTRKSLYLSLVRSKMSYCSQLWRPYLIKDIVTLENVQQRATKFILNDYTSNYKDRLITLNLLPLMYWYKLQDILFFIKCLQSPDHNGINIFDFVQFSSSTTRFASQHKLLVKYRRSSKACHFYFVRIAHLWNALPPINVQLPLHAIKTQLINFFRNHFITKFNSTSPCSFHFVCPCCNCHLS